MTHRLYTTLLGAQNARDAAARAVREQRDRLTAAQREWRAADRTFQAVRRNWLDAVAQQEEPA